MITSGVSPRASAIPPWQWANWVSHLPGTGKKNTDIVPASVSASRVIIVHEPAHIRAALEAAAVLDLEELTVSSAPGAAGYAGPQWFANVIADAAATRPEIRLRAILDCGDRPGHALTALRLGITDISLTGKTRGKVAAIAKKMKARLHNPAHGASLDLIGEHDPRSVCVAWLRRRS